MATEEAITERVLDVFQSVGSKGLMAEEVFPLYEAKYGDTSRSNSIHTTISRLTKQGHLAVVGTKESPTSHKKVTVWAYVENGSPVTAVTNKTAKQAKGDRAADFARLHQSLMSLDSQLQKGNLDADFLRSYITDAQQAATRLQMGL